MKSNNEIIILESYSDISTLCKDVEGLDQNLIESILGRVRFPITVVLDHYYVDKVYRDAYYLYFSRKHFSMSRNCKRLSFFIGSYKKKDFLKANSERKYRKLQEALIGMTVVRPTPRELKNCTVGRTLIDPRKIGLDECFIRTTLFDVSILGVEFTIDAFPFAAQDGEVMSCAETTIWAIMEYFSSRYPNYKSILPSEIIKQLNLITPERTLPSKGLTYTELTSLLKSFGFEPRRYLREFYKKQLNDEKSNDKLNLFRRIFHYYVESAIPVAIAVGDGQNDGHSISCIGHAKANFKKEIKDRINCGDVKYIDSADFYNAYVLMDDTETPYCIKDYDHFCERSMDIQVISVPLYKHIYLDAADANSIISVFLETYSSVINNAVSEHMKIENVVYRIFLTTSRNYKRFRSSKAKALDEKKLYSDSMLMPKFIWICELSKYDDYVSNGNVFGEIVIDATASAESGIDSIIFIRFAKAFAFRGPEESSSTIQQLEEGVHFSVTYPCYTNNLSNIRREASKN